MHHCFRLARPSALEKKKYTRSNTLVVRASSKPIQHTSSFRFVDPVGVCGRKLVLRCFENSDEHSGRSQAPLDTHVLGRPSS